MKYLKRFNESKNNITLVEFLHELNNAIKSIGFLVCTSKGFGEHMSPITNIDDWDKYLKDPNDSYIEICKDSDDLESDTYIDFDLIDFSIKELKSECNKFLDDDKSTWPASDLVKDDYDLLCTTILTFLDEKNYGKIKF